MFKIKSPLKIVRRHKSKALLLFTLLLAYLLAGTNLLAQTTFEIAANSSDMEAEYRDELDKSMLRAYEGDADAQFKVGVLFTNDQFDQPDHEQAVYWYKQAARQGHALAQYNLGHLYLTGKGVEKNETEGLRWWLHAAKQEHALAQFNVGRAYYLGIGLNKDHQQSRKWFQRAAQNQEEKSIQILQELGWSDDLDLEPQSDSQSTIVETKAVTGAATAAVVTKQQIIATEPIELTSNPLTTSPVALYTDPAIRSVLISIADHKETLEVVSEGNTWMTVKSSVGFPVWVHSDFLQVSDARASVIGNDVNARSVPMVSRGTIVGKLNEGESVNIIDEKEHWYRVMSPKHFIVWAKSEDYNRPAQYRESLTALTSSESLSSSEPSAPEEPSVSEEPSASQEKDNNINDNAWLFSQAKGNWTLQLASINDPTLVNDFLSRSKLSDNPEMHRFTSGTEKDAWTYFLFGSYQNRAAAEESKGVIGQNRAWARTFGQLQENRCLSWKTKSPIPQELDQYCI